MCSCSKLNDVFAAFGLRLSTLFSADAAPAPSERKYKRMTCSPEIYSASYERLRSVRALRNSQAVMKASPLTDQPHEMRQTNGVENRRIMSLLSPR